MKNAIDPETVTSLLSAFTQMPGRLAALERGVADLSAKMEMVYAAMPPLLVTMPAAAAMFKVSVPTMRRWVRAGEVPVVRVQNTIRVDMNRIRGLDSEDSTRLARETRQERVASYGAPPRSPR